jgi:predicted flap endonuclease-1-like 5' DNA nuclease
MSTKITFTLPAEVVANANSGLLLGDFNNWDDNKAPQLKKQKDGSMKATLALEEGKTYQYRYLLDDGRWVNDYTAETYAHVSGYGVDNCVITIPAKNAAETVSETEKPSKKDDLTKIEGIGKKIAEILTAAGIASFEILAKATPKKLRSILDEAGKKFKTHDPATWPKQAKLAAAGKWTELKKIQAQLKTTKETPANSAE